MSVNRSNSQVRNLRAMFENSAPPSRTSTDSTSPERGRSNGPLSPGPDRDRPLSTVRASFVSVEPTAAMEIDPEKTKQEHGARQGSTASFRRESFSFDEAGDSDAIAELKKTISQESERRGSNPSVAETIPEAAIEATPAATTPAVEAKDYMAAGQHTTTDKAQVPSKLRDVMTPGAAAAAPAPRVKTQPQPLPPAADDDLPADNPDKPVSGLQAEPGPMQPSDLKDRAAVSPAASPAPEAEEQPVAALAPVPASASASAPAPVQQTPPRARRGTISAVDVPAATGSAPVPVAVEPPSPGSAAPAAPDAAAPAPSPKRPTHIDIDVNKSPEPVARPPRTPPSVKKTPSSAKPSPPSSVLSPKPSAKNLAAAAPKSHSPQSKPLRQRSPAKPAKQLPSHLSAPTASSAAKHDVHPSTKPGASAAKPAPAARPAAAATKPAPTARAPPRAQSATSKPVSRPSIAPAAAAAAHKKPEPRPAPTSSKGADEGFLARMMRPTASSANRAHDKTEVKIPPKRTPSVVKAKAAVKPKTAKIEKPATNGAKPSSSSSSSKEPKPEATDAPVAETPQDAGASTPQATSGAQDQPSDATLQATPAFNSATIR